GHRGRVRERFRNEGLDSFETHEILELLLFYAIQRGDTNETAHNLVKRFGTLARVFDAPISELKKVDGIGDSSAVLLKLIPAVTSRYMISLDEKRDEIPLDNSEKVKKYILPCFIGRASECIYLIATDSTLRPIGCELISSGSMSTAEADMRKMMEYALSVGARYVILSHNHPNGTLNPSREDIRMTQHVSQTFASVGITMIDHIIVSNNHVLSMMEQGYVKNKSGVLMGN
ncbi:MAG: hypothetical protein GX633_00535, partial [Clostridiales bacterium]|nr:hypothetical protein [Clostridiales bacterium]